MQQHLRSSGELAGRQLFGNRVTSEANANSVEPNPMRLWPNETLAGRRKDSSGRTPMRLPPVLDRETCEQIQAELDKKHARAFLSCSRDAQAAAR